MVAPQAPRADWWIASIFLARILMYANFMVYAACLPVLLKEWGMSATRAGTISAGFMVGYAVSLFVFSWAADRFGAKRMFLWSAVLNATAALAFGLFARSYETGLILYTLAALSQGGLYGPAVMLFSDRYPPQRRGRAVGYLIASTSMGYALSLVMSGLYLRYSGYEAAFVATGIVPILGAILSAFVLRDTPNRIHLRQANAFGAGRILRSNRNAALLVGGYVFHNWELVGMWSWTPAFLTAAFALSGGDLAATAHLGALLTASMHLVGSFASASMGRLSDRLGRRRVLITAAAIATCCSFGFGWMVAWPAFLLTLVGVIYYFTALGDSPVLTTALSETVDPGILGAVLAMRMLLGFIAGAIAPVVFGLVLDLTNTGTIIENWGWAFVSLGVGGLLATLCAYYYQGNTSPDGA